MLRIFLLAFGVFCGSTAVLMIKASTLHPALLSAHRLLIATALLSPVFVWKLRQHQGEYSWTHLQRSVLPAFALGLHFISWAQGAQLTEPANASLIVNMIPVVMPFLLYFTAHEVITKGEISGTVISLLGVGLLTATDFTISHRNLIGDLTCFGSMILFAYYLVLGRVNRDLPDIWLYLIPLYGMAGLFCLVVSCFVTQPFAVYAPREYLLSFGLAAIPTIIGHSIFNYSMKHLRGQIVSVFNVCQFIFAGLLAYLFLGTMPHPAFYPASALVVGGALVVIRASTATRDKKTTDLSTLPLEEAV